MKMQENKLTKSHKYAPITWKRNKDIKKGENLELSKNKPKTWNMLETFLGLKSDFK